MKETVKLIGFILLAIGTLGILITEFVFDWWGWQYATMVFAASNVAGFAALALAHWIVREK